MKNILKLSLGVLLLTNSFSSAYAGSGKAISPMWDITSTRTCYIHISNITTHNLQVSVTFYKNDGTTVTSGITYNNLQSSNTVLNAGNSAFIQIDAAATSQYGYAVIHWSNDVSSEDDVVGLVAHGFCSGSDNRYAVPVNNGMPF